MLVVAEADEVFMNGFGHGWDCGASNGEALSRILAAEIYPQERVGSTGDDRTSSTRPRPQTKISSLLDAGRYLSTTSVTSLGFRLTRSSPRVPRHFHRPIRTSREILPIRFRCSPACSSPDIRSVIPRGWLTTIPGPSPATRRSASNVSPLGGGFKHPTASATT
jgi:hypothetical protein